MAAASILPAAWVLSRVLRGDPASDTLSMLVLVLVSIATFVPLVRRLDPAVAEDCGRLAQGVLRHVKKPRMRPT
jgi:hypothetical protein